MMAGPRPRDLLRELNPLVERALDRHLTSAKEWFPHEYVPYEVGRNFCDEPWQESDSRLPEVAQVALELNLLTEDNLPYYHLALVDAFERQGAWGEWIRRWTAEEGRHAIVLRDFLTVTRGIDPMKLERGRMGQVTRGYYAEWPPESVLDGVVYATLQELATRISHRNTGLLTSDPLAERLTARIAVDENLHYVFYRDVGAGAIEVEPSAMVLAVQRQVAGFAMPGLHLPEFRAKARRMAWEGIYDLRIHHDQVVSAVLFKHWKLDNITGLTDEAQQARDDILMFLGALDEKARRFEEKRAEAKAGGAQALDSLSRSDASMASPLEG